MSNKIATAAKTALLGLVTAAVTLGLAGPADAASRTMYGDPAAAAEWWQLQQYDDCAIMAAADVVGQMTGKEPSETAIIRVAQSTPSAQHPGSIYIKPSDTDDPNSGQGTNRLDLPTLLARYGIEAKMTSTSLAAKTGLPTGLEALEQYLADGHAVIASVNAELIWGEPIDQKDDNGNPVSDHSLVVTGVDPVLGIVHLNDSGTAKGRDEQVPLELFLKAWTAGHYFMLVTTGTVKAHPQAA